MNPPSTATVCEVHDVAGECTEECVALIQMMSGDAGSDPMVYGDYLGGESMVDWSRTHAPAPRMETVYRLDPVRRAVVAEEVCPYEDEHDAMPCEVCGFLGG